MNNSIFNFKKYKIARRGMDPPVAFQPLTDYDPYDSSREPNDGKGYKMNTPGSEGLSGSKSDMSASSFGVKERAGYPRNISLYDQEFSDNNPRYNIPGDKDPEHPFNPNMVSDDNTQYGTGAATDMGQLFHDDMNNLGDAPSPLGRNMTSLRRLEEKDRVFPFNNMNGKSIFEKVRKRQKGY